jgi:hypothetical protein
MDETIEDTYQDRLERENAHLRAELVHERFLREQAEARETGRDDGQAIVRAEVLRELLEWEAHYMQQARGGDQSGRSDARADAAREIHDNLRSSWETRELVANSKPAEASVRGTVDAMLLSLIERLQARADNAYCEMIAIARKDESLGWEIKVERGEFGRAELDAHCAAANFTHTTTTGRNCKNWPRSCNASGNVMRSALRAVAVEGTVMPRTTTEKEHG